MISSLIYCSSEDANRINIYDIKTSNVEDEAVISKDSFISQINTSILNYENTGVNFYIEDLKSRNGTLLNNRPVTEPTKLNHRDRIQICSIVMYFYADGQEHEQGNVEDFQAQIAAVLLKRGPALEEFARTIRFLYDTPSITGQMIALDGGQHLAWETPDLTGISE